MLSILIPTYNEDITDLVDKLHRQLLDQMVDFEIIVMEDGSNQYVESNKSIGNLKNCRQIILTENIGRSAIRNKLADISLYEHLLFIDCDAKVCTEHYIEKYLSFCKEDGIVIGGTAYDPNEKKTEYSLRLTYGRKREARHANERNKNNFSTFNFLISKNIFQQVRFDESIRGYGHEDMLFGHLLHELGYEFIQIENPLIHSGLDDNTTFIQKTEEATKNLYLLYRTGKYPYLSKESTLIKSYLTIEKNHLKKAVALLFSLTSPLMRKQLCSSSPSLLLYDFYKLAFMCKISMSK